MQENEPTKFKNYPCACLTVDPQDLHHIFAQPLTQCRYVTTIGSFLTELQITIANLFNRTSTNNQYDVINFGLKHGTAIKPKENDTFVFA